MALNDYQRVLRNGRFLELVQERTRFAWTLSIAMLVIYFGFVLLVAFAKPLLAVKIGGGVTSLGILLGLAVIVAAFVLTGIYVHRANSRFDEITRSLQRDIALMTPAFPSIGIGLACGAFLACAVLAAGPDLGAVQKQSLNWVAVSMFLLFVLGTLGITYRAAMQTKSAADFYAAGGGITGLPERPRDRRRLHVGGIVPRHLRPGLSSGFDGLIYSIGFLVGWPIVLFLIAERLRNLGKFTFADVASFRLDQTPIRILSATGTLVVVAFYLIAQMVGAGKLIQLLFGLDYLYAVVIVGILMIVYVAFGGMKATTWVQIIKACLLLAGATFMAFMVLCTSASAPKRCSPRPSDMHPKGDAIMAPGGWSRTRSRRSRSASR